MKPPEDIAPEHPLVSGAATGLPRNPASIFQVVLSVEPVTFGPATSALQFVSFVDRVGGGLFW